MSLENNHIPAFNYVMVIFIAFFVLAFDSAPNASIYLSWGGAFFLVLLYLIFKFVKPAVSIVNIKIFMMLFSWVLFAVCVTPFVFDKGIHLKLILISAAYTLFSVVFINYLYQNKKLLKGLGTLFIFWVGFELVFLLLFVSSGGESASLSGRFCGSYYNPNTMGVIASFAFLYLLVFRKFIRVSSQMLLSLVLLCIVIFIMLSGSAKGFLGLFFILSGFSVLGFRRKKKFLMLVAVFACVLVMPLIFSHSSDRLLAKLSAFDREAEFSVDNIAGGRLFLVLEGLRVISENPIIGVGVHNSQYYIFLPRYYIHHDRGHVDAEVVGVYSHNNFIEMYLNAGFPAFVLFYIPIVFVLWKTYKTRPFAPLMRRFRIFILLAIPLKLFFDLAMVSYSSFIHIFIMSLCFVLYFRFIRPDQRGRSSASRIELVEA